MEAVIIKAVSGYVHSCVEKFCAVEKFIVMLVNHKYPMINSVCLQFFSKAGKQVLQMAFAVAEGDNDCKAFVVSNTEISG